MPQPVPRSEIENRTIRFQEHIRSSGMEAALIVQRVDLLYFSGTSQNAFLYMPAEGEPLLLVKKYLPRARIESRIRRIIGIQSITDIPLKIREIYGRLPKSLGLEFDVLPVRDFRYYENLFDPADCVDASASILEVRKIKSDWEIDQMEEVAERSCKTFEFMSGALRPGISEMEFAGMCETYARKLGHEGMLQDRNFRMKGYPWHVLSGKNGGELGLLDSPASGSGMSPAFPSGAGRKLISTDEPIMVDFGWVRNGYHMDETRMFVVGKMPEDALNASEAAIDIHNEVIEKAAPGIAVSELFDTAVSRAETLGYADTFLGPPGEKVTFIGHGIGLELVEPPIIARGKPDILVPGMTLAVEPKIVFEKRFCVGVESVIRITQTGSRIISKVPVRIFCTK